MFAYFQSTLEKYNRPFRVLKGDKSTRLKAAIAHIDNLMKNACN